MHLQWAISKRTDALLSFYQALLTDLLLGFFYITSKFSFRMCGTSIVSQVSLIDHLREDTRFSHTQLPMSSNGFQDVKFQVHG